LFKAVVLESFVSVLRSDLGSSAMLSCFHILVFLPCKSLAINSYADVAGKVDDKILSLNPTGYVNNFLSGHGSRKLGGQGERNDIRFFDTHQKQGENITMASLFYGREATWNMVWENHMAYAKAKGLNYLGVVGGKTVEYGHFDRSVKPTWFKFAIITYLFDEGADAVFWMDGDSIFTNCEKDVRSLLAPGKDFVFDGDFEVLMNAGHFLIRKSEWSRWFLQEAYKVYPPPVWNDNGAFLVFLSCGTRAQDRNNWQECESKVKDVRCITSEDMERCMELVDPELRPHVHGVAQDEWNSYGRNGGVPLYTSEEVEAMEPRSRPFVLHRAGDPIEKKERDLTKMAPLLQCHGGSALESEAGSGIVGEIIGGLGGTHWPIVRRAPEIATNRGGV